MPLYAIIMFSIVLYFTIGVSLSALSASVFEMESYCEEDKVILSMVIFFWPILVLWTLYIVLLMIIGALFASIEYIIKRIRGRQLFLLLFLGLLSLGACTKQEIPPTPNDPTVVVRGPTSAPVGTSVTFTVESPDDWTEHYRWEVPWGWDVEYPRIYITTETTITHTFEDAGLQHLRVFCYSLSDLPPLIGMHNISIYE